MSPVSLYFLLFLAASVLIYYLLPKKGQWIWLLIASLVFYVLCSQGLLLVLLWDSILVFFFGKYFETKKKKRMMVLLLFLLTATLLLLKYASVLGQGWLSFLQVFSFGKASSYLAPLGLSYFTVMAIAYAVDVFRGTIPAEKNYPKFLLFFAFFPVMTQGPICRYGELSAQLFAPHTFSYENLTSGAQRILWGFFKKLLISERLAVVAAHITEGWAESPYTGFWVIVSFFAFSFCLYMDFSGCMDIVIGTAEIFGITLPENFNHSYLSKTIPEFWRRWHITLGTWLRDYVMYSFTMSRLAKWFTKKTKAKIGRKAAATIVTCVGIALVWLVYALWHDISAVFLVSGGFYATIIILGTVFDPWIKKFRSKCKGLVSSLPYRIFMVLRTLLLSTAGAFFVFMPSVADGASYFWKLWKAPTGVFLGLAKGSHRLLHADVLGLKLPDFCVLLCAFVLWLVVSRLHAKKDPRVRLSQIALPLRWAILLVLILAVVVFGEYGGLEAGSFVYQGY